MLRVKNIFIKILFYIILVYILMTQISNNKVYSATRTEDLTNLEKYPEIYTAIQEMKTAHPNWTFTIL